jgi:DNA-directed RNA polymerase
LGYSLENQLELEQQMLTAGIDRFRKERDTSIQKGRESNTLHGRTMIATVVANTAAGVKKLQETPTSNRDIAYKKLQGLKPDKVAYLALVSMVDGISYSNTLMKVAKSIGSNVEMQDRLEKWIEAEGSIARNTIKKANEKGITARRFGLTNKMNKDGYKEYEWTSEERIHVGLRLIDIIIQNTGIVKLQKLSTSRTKTTTFLRATDITEEWVKLFNEHMETQRPRWTPCIIPPKDWTAVYGGGYHAEFLQALPIVRRG